MSIAKAPSNANGELRDLPPDFLTQNLDERKMTGAKFIPPSETSIGSDPNPPDDASTIIMKNEVANLAAFGSFNQKFQKFFRSAEAGTSDSNLEEKYKIFLKESVEVYQKLRGLGGDEIEAKYIEQLTGQCEENFNLIYKRINGEIRKRKETDEMRDKEREENSRKLKDLSNQVEDLRGMIQKKVDEITQSQLVKDAEYQNMIQGLNGQINELNSQKSQIEERMKDMREEHRRCINEEIERRTETDEMRNEERRENLKKFKDLNSQMENMRHLIETKVDEMTQSEKRKNAEYKMEMQLLSTEIEDLKDPRKQMSLVGEANRLFEEKKKSDERERLRTILNPLQLSPVVQTKNECKPT